MTPAVVDESSPASLAELLDLASAAVAHAAEALADGDVEEACEYIGAADLELGAARQMLDEEA